LLNPFVAILYRLRCRSLKITTAVRYDGIVTSHEKHLAGVKTVKRLAPARLRP
jgi:hypothetical protein